MTANKTVLFWGIGTAVLAGVGALALYIHRSHAPDLVGLAYLDGMQADKRGDLSGAAAKYMQATLLDPKFCSGYFDLGNTYERQTKTSEALASFQRALACFQGGTVHSFLGRPSEQILKGEILRTTKRIEALQKISPGPQP